MKLTKNFKLNEFLIHYDGELDEVLTLNLLRVACVLQMVRSIVNEPIYITSGLRTKERNKQVGGVPNSLHLVGLAADFQIRIKSNTKLFDSCNLVRGYLFEEIKFLKYDNHVHLQIQKI